MKINLFLRYPTQTHPYYVNRYSDDKKKWRGNRLGDRGHDNANVLVMQFGFP